MAKENINVKEKNCIDINRKKYEESRQEGLEITSR